MVNGTSPHFDIKIHFEVWIKLKLWYPMQASSGQWTIRKLNLVRCYCSFINDVLQYLNSAFDQLEHCSITRSPNTLWVIISHYCSYTVIYFTKLRRQFIISLLWQLLSITLSFYVVKNEILWNIKLPSDSATLTLFLHLPYIPSAIS